MQLITAKCPDCGADLKIPEGSASVVCDYCGGNILVSDVLGSGSVMQNCMILAYSALESRNYNDAYDHFNRAIEIDMKNPNAWFGKAFCEGMIGKIGENSFGQMIDMFENALNYTPADKQSNMKKNAAAEIVKVVRKSAGIVQLVMQLTELSDDDAELAASAADNAKQVKDTVTNTVTKAQEYDPSSKDVEALLNEITSGKFFNPNQKSALKSDAPDSGIHLDIPGTMTE
jgi:tetratricopeptide (TPR) repeat protein